MKFRCPKCHTVQDVSSSIFPKKVGSIFYIECVECKTEFTATTREASKSNFCDTIKKIETKKIQLVILWIGVISIALICIFPPTYVLSGGHYPNPSVVTNTDTDKLIRYCLAVGIVTGGLIYALRVVPQLPEKICRRFFSTPESPISQQNTATGEQQKHPEQLKQDDKKPPVETK
jgi:hypothetical protein